MRALLQSEIGYEYLGWIGSECIGSGDGYKGLVGYCDERYYCKKAVGG